MNDSVTPILIQNKVVVVTGAGRGLGRELARRFVAEGAYVCALGRSEQDLRETGADLANGRYLPLVVDITDYERLAMVFEEIIAAYGRIDVLFNNAALYPRSNFLEESAVDWKKAIESNVTAMGYCCKLALPHMITNGWGRIYNLGSWADLTPIPKSAAYSASKGAVRALTKAIGLDIDHLEKDVEVHEWIPGGLNTRMSEFTGIDPAISAGWAIEMVKRHNPSHRSRVFENDCEWHPPVRIKTRILRSFFFWRLSKPD